jgi:hypothetical protein
MRAFNRGFIHVPEVRVCGFEVNAPEIATMIGKI